MKKTIMIRVLCGFIFLMIMTLAACSGAGEETLSFTAMDTVMSLKAWGGDGVCESIRDRAGELDRELSAVDENSEVFALNRDGSASLGEDSAALIKRSLELGRELDGSFDITVYPAVREWGFTTGEYNVPTDERLDELADKIDYTAVELNGNTAALPEGVMIDLGAIAKGYLADEAKKLLDSSGAKGAVLNLGGTILMYGKKPDGSPFTVGIADPESPAAYFGYLSLSEGVAATSGGYERYFERDSKRYIHILDPTTARPVDNGVLSVTVICGEGVRADAMSTALFVMGADGAADYYRAHGGFDCVILTGDGELYITEGIAGSFTLSGGYDYKIHTISR